MAGRGNKLNDEQRAFLVREIACFARPTEAAEALFAEYGIEVTATNVEKYDYTKRAGRRCAKKWKVLLKATRAAFIKNIANRVPHAHKSYRIKKLAKAADDFERVGNWMQMANMLEKVAKEIGGAYTNRFEHTGKDGGPIKYQPVQEMTEDELDAEIASHGIDPASIVPGTRTTH